MLEVCIDSLESAKNAIYGGADELEVCSSLNQGGLTPTAGLVKSIQTLVDQYMLEVNEQEKEHRQQRPKINVMIRCRSGPDFHYSDLEMETMVQDIRIFKDMGVDRFVFGALDEDRDIDIENCKKVISEAIPLPVTFHRAFDLCKDPMEALKIITDLGFQRLLTSGQKEVAHTKEAMELIQKIIVASNGKIQIMPGSGVSVANVKKFVEIGCEIVHSSCKVVKKLPEFKNDLSMGDLELFVTGKDVVEDMKKVLNNKLE